MCGIICEINRTGSSEVNREDIVQYTKRRGPDFSGSCKVIDNDYSCTFYATVLWMQGSTVQGQPIENDQGILLFNGDIFDETWDKHLCDSLVILQKLSNKKENNIIQEIKQFKGPFSLIYYNKSSHELYFVRDRIGRNSLLLHKYENGFLISSVLSKQYRSVEIPATYIYRLNLITNTIDQISWHSNKDSTLQYPLEEWISVIEDLQSKSDDVFTYESKNSNDLVDENNTTNFIEQVVELTDCKENIMFKLLDNPEINKTLLKIIDLLEKSVKIRVQTQPGKCKMCITIKGSICTHSALGILFSGGLDCTILAFLADKYVPREQSIDLLNVAFKKDNSSFDVPDRITGRKSYEELKLLAPNREWIFREIDVCQEALEELRQKRIGDLIYPRQTVLDENLGSALWFAAQGKDNKSITSPSRVVLVGSGADELFGGYLRHRKAFQRHGWAGLSRELEFDWKRISFRNLARDNRVICDHGRQPRMPYLDEDFTQFVLQLKPWLKCYPSEQLNLGIGDKLMLRLVAYNIGLKKVALEPKRALQFGSRIANKKDKGSDISKIFQSDENDR